MKARLSKRVIDEAEYQGPGGCYLWDADLAGYGLRIYPTGRKSFVITYQARGRQRFYTLGRYGELTPSPSAHRGTGDAGSRPQGSHGRRPRRSPHSRPRADQVQATKRRLGDALIHFEQHTETSPHAIAAIRLLILTGCRSAEILKLRWPRICRHAGIQDVRIHDLRHTFASYGVNGGQGLPVIGKLLGHSKITTTQRYAHLDDDPVRAAP